MTTHVLKTRELIDCIRPLRVAGETAGAVTGLVYDSRRVSPGCAFFALRGSHVDGHRFIDEAIARGAAVIVTEEPLEISGATALTVANARRALAEASALFFGQPARQMRVVGVTGTNGKTTITYLLEAILAAARLRPAVIGTVNYRYAGNETEASHTTPESYHLQEVIAGFRQQGADALIMEVSSHALEQNRVAGIGFEVGIFTNLTPEHLDYHQTMDAYFASKKKLFDEYIVPQGGRPVVNIDDPYGRVLAAGLGDALTCGLSDDAAVRAENVVLSRDGIRAEIVSPRGRFGLRSELLGNFSVSNILCAVSAAMAMEISIEAILEGISRVPVVPGRIEKIGNDRDALILVDYAHTGDALENVLKAVTGLGARRVITVFGCGGDRDRSKRPVMGEIAARYSDLVIVTSDNPRTEDPQGIIDEILPGVRRHFSADLDEEQLLAADARGVYVTADRRAALNMGVAALQPGDLLLVAGKGHEDYQILGTEKTHFDDREEIREALRAPGRH